MRAFFTALLWITAIGKLLDNRGFAEILGQYELGIPEPLLLPMALAVSLVELAMATAIAAGHFLRPMAQLTVLMHAGYAAVAALTNLRGIELANCGCFGVFLARPMSWTTVIEDIGLTLLALVFLYGVTRDEAGSQAERAERRAVGTRRESAAEGVLTSD